MEVLIEEVYTVISAGLTLALLSALVVAAAMAVVMRVWLALGGLRRRSASWTRGARGFHVVFWVLAPSLLAASIGLLRGVETQSLAAIDRHRPAMERWVQQTWRDHGESLDAPAQELAEHRRALEQAVADMPGWQGRLMEWGLAGVERWVVSAIGALDVRSPGWSERPVATLSRQWELAFLALYLSLLAGLAPLLVLPVAEWLASLYAAKQPLSEETL